MKTRLRKTRATLLGLLSLGATAALIAGCGGGSSSGSGSAHPTMSSARPVASAPQSAPATPRAARQPSIPQNNGGDMDADNNGGPSDGDGNI
jgi:hypothetical protein